MGSFFGSETLPKVLTKHSTSTKPWVRTRSESKINPPKDVKFLFSGCGANLRALEGGTEGASREQLFEFLGVYSDSWCSKR